MQQYKKYTIKDFGDVVTGNTPSTTKIDYWNGNIPFYSPTDFSENVYCNSTEKTITELGLKQGRTIPPNSIMVTCIASIGKIAINDKIGITNQQINTIIPYEQFDYKYLYYLINQHIYRLANSAPQTAVPIINKTEFEKTSMVCLINKIEQTKIANILSTCDEVIEKTEGTIEKYKQIKAGMMQDLFTRGLDENGKLRPKYEVAPDLYKYSSELDRHIPKDWEVKRFIDLYEIPSKNGLTKPSRVRGNGYKMINMGELFANRKIGNIPMELVPLTTIEKKNNEIKELDLLFARQSLVADGAGKCSIVILAKEYITFESHIIRIRLCKDKCTPLFYFYLFDSNISPIKKLIQVGAQAGIRGSELALVNVILPIKMQEQIKINNMLDSIDNKIEIEKQCLTKYKQIKQGLMKKLLTPPSDAEIVEE